MAYDPIGAFDPHAPLLDEAVAKAVAITKTFPAIPAGMVHRVYLHWAVAPFGCLFGDYNYMVDFENGVWVMKMTHNPQDNMPGLNNNAMASHTWQRNTSAIGISIAGMDQATTTNFGPDGVQLHELEHICALAAAVCKHYGVDTMGKVAAPGETHPSSNDSGNHPGNVNTTGEWNIETHATCAMYDDYRGERWDFGTLHAMPSGYPLTDADRIASAAALRERVHVYATNL